MRIDDHNAVMQGRTPASVATPAAGTYTWFVNSDTGHYCQMDSSRNVLDLTPPSQLDSVGFDTAIAWNFNSTVEGWTASNGTIAFDSSNGKGALLTDTSFTLPVIAVSPSGLSIDGNLYRRVKASITFITAPAPITVSVPQLRYHTAGHGSDVNFSKTTVYPTPFATAGDTVVIDFDMETATGAPDWYAPPNNTITQIRLLLTDPVPSGTVLRVNWVAIGRDAPPDKTVGAGTTVKGTTLLDFSAGNNTKITVTGQSWVTATSAIIASVNPVATAEHSEDEHLILSSCLGLSVPPSSIVPGVGFDIVGVVNSLGIVGGTVNVGWIGVP